MNKLLQKITVVFAAGCLGGLVNSLVFWLFCSAGILSRLSIRITPGDMPAWLYPRVVWGGIWGLLFLLPILRSKPIYQALLFSLGPSLAQFLVFFPREGHGYYGLSLGNLTPLAVFFFNLVWAVTTVLWLQVVAGGEKKKP